MEPSRRLDRASVQEARGLLSACCGSSAWVERMLRRRPFRNDETLATAAREAWIDLTQTDWLEAYSQHPKVGDRASLAKRFPETAHLSAQEQSGIEDATVSILDDLAAGNRAYEEKFGYIFIVCATGKSAAQMLALLRARLHNDAATEIRVAAEEQGKITQLRLERLGQAAGLSGP